MSSELQVVEHATCLGCGCGCDDITVVVRDGRITETMQVCPLGERWFGDGQLPTTILVRRREQSLDAALDEAAVVLAGARRPLVYLGPDLSTEAQAEAIAIADRLHGRVDSVTSDTVAEGILAAQRRGRAGATLGEILNRADMVVFWGVDPAERYPRYGSRYAIDREGVHVPHGRAGRVVVGVDIGTSAGPADCDLRVSLEPAQEVGMLAVLRACVLGRNLGELPPGMTAAADLARRMLGAKYVVLVHDAEPSTLFSEPGRAEGLIALVQALNAVTRAALSSLRGGGNRSGADAVMTWQTGYPFAVDFQRGHPRYCPHDSASVLIASGAVDAVLLLGSWKGIPTSVVNGVQGVPVAAIGPRASEAAFADPVAIDTGVAGIHYGGTAYRMDDISLPLRPSVGGHLAVPEVLLALEHRLRELQAAGTR